MQRLLAFIVIGFLLMGCIGAPPGANSSSRNNSIPRYQARDYCEKDSDCVRQESCCDCGLGVYVNTYNHQNISCDGKPRCMCPYALSKGVCINNKCAAVSAYSVTSKGNTSSGGQFCAPVNYSNYLKNSGKGCTG